MSKMKSELEQLIGTLQSVADNESIAGNLAVSGVLLTARQTIRVLWTELEKLQKPAETEVKPDIAPPVKNGKNATPRDTRLSPRT